MSAITCLDQLLNLNSQINSRLSSGYASDTEEVDSLMSGLTLQGGATEVVSSSEGRSFKLQDLFYSDIEIDELAQKLETSIYRPGTYIYLDPRKTRVEAPEMFYLGTWPYVETAQNSSKKLEMCLFSTLNYQQAVLFINVFKPSLVKVLPTLGGETGKFEAILKTQYERNLSELEEFEVNNNEVRNFIFVKSMKSAFKLAVPKEKQSEAMEVFSRNLGHCFTIAYLGIQSRNASNHVVIDVPVTDRKRFIEANVNALFRGMETIRKKYEPLIEGPKGFFAKIATIVKTMENTATEVKFTAAKELLPNGIIEIDETFEESSDLRIKAEKDLDNLDEIYDSLLKLLQELNADLDTFQSQREVMTDVHYANQRYKEKAVASYPYLTSDKTIRIDKANALDESFGLFLEDFYEDVESVYFSHIVYFRKAITAVENVRETLSGIIDKYQELIAFS